MSTQEAANSTNVQERLKVTAYPDGSNPGFALPLLTDYQLRLNPINVVSQATYVAVTTTRPGNVTPYTAGDAVGAASAILVFGTFGNGSDHRMITTAELRYDAASVPAGMAGFRLHLYQSSPTAIADNAAWDLVSADRVAYEGYIDFPVPIDMGSTLYSRVLQVNQHIKMGAFTLYGILQTIGGYTPAAASETFRVSLGSYRL